MSTRLQARVEHADALALLLERLLQRMEVGLLLLTLLVVNYQVVMRYAFNSATSWSDPLATTSFAWGTILGSAAATNRGANLALGFVVQRVAGSVRQGFLYLAELLMLGFGLLAAYSGVLLVQATWTAELAGMTISQGLVYSCLPAFGIIVVLFAVLRVCRLALHATPQPHRDVLR